METEAPACTAANSPTQSGRLVKHERRSVQQISPNQLDPNRRFNPDVLFTIAELLADAEEYQTVINLSCVSRHIGGSLKSYRQRLRKRLILKLDDLNLEETGGWSTIK